MTGIETLFLKYNFQKRVLSFQNIDKIEVAVGFELPADYKFYLANYAGFEGFIAVEYLVLWDASELLQLNEEYGISENLPETIAIGSNGAGEFIGIGKNAQGSYSYFISPFIDLDETSHQEVGDSFTDLLERLDSGRSYFNN